MKYNEKEFLEEALEYIESTYDQHYVGEEDLQIVDMWHMNGSVITTCRDVAQKYLARYGRKEGFNKKDLLKAVHYIVMMAHFQELREKREPIDKIYFKSEVRDPRE